MGYSHYWETNGGIEDEQWLDFTDFVNMAIGECGAKIVNGAGEKGTIPAVTGTSVALNGEGDDESYETFNVGRFDVGFNFCKTDRRPYDTLVVACLIAGTRLGIFSKWSSDGDHDELVAGRNLYNEISAYLTDRSELDPLDKLQAEVLEGYEAVFDDVDAGYVDGITAAISAVKERIK